MLRQRIVTAFFMVSTFLLINFLPVNGLFIGFVFICVLIGAWEWSRLGGLNKFTHRCLYLLAIMIALMLVYYFKENLALVIIAFAAIWWFSRVILLLTNKLPNNKVSLLLSGMWVLVSASLAMILLHAIDPSILLVGLLWVWVADSFAYFVGKRFGKNKLAPLISPGKTIEGVIGGCLGVLLFAIACALYLGLSAASLPLWLLGAILVSLFSVGGDLYESWMKRNLGVKDSGNLLPGHGGVLDRIDGLVAAMPFYYLLIIWFFYP